MLGTENLRFCNPTMMTGEAMALEEEPITTVLLHEYIVELPINIHAYNHRLVLLCKYDQNTLYTCINFPKNTSKYYIFRRHFRTTKHE